MEQDQPMEHVVDLATGQESDRPFEGEQPPGVGAIEAAQMRRVTEALGRLRKAAENGHQLVQDLLTVMGLDE